MTTKNSLSTYVIPGLQGIILHSKQISVQVMHINPADLTSQTRKREIVYARWICMVMLSKYTRMTKVWIGGILGEKDHTTVLYAIAKVNDALYLANNKNINTELSDKFLEADKIMRQKYDPVSHHPVMDITQS